MKAVITLKIAKGTEEPSTCNMIESLDKTFERLYERIKHVESKGYRVIGNVTIQFVQED